MERLIAGRISANPAGRAVALDWTEGWAVLPAFGEKAHWFRREAARAVSIDGVPQLVTPVATACGEVRFETLSVGLRFMAGFTKCMRCEAARGEKA
jgi:hypothetical protein